MPDVDQGAERMKKLWDRAVRLPPRPEKDGRLCPGERASDLDSMTREIRKQIKTMKNNISVALSLNPFQPYLPQTYPILTKPHISLDQNFTFP